MYIVIILVLIILLVGVYMTIKIGREQKEEDLQLKTNKRYKRLLSFYIIGSIIGLVIFLIYLISA